MPYSIGQYVKYKHAVFIVIGLVDGKVRIKTMTSNYVVNPENLESTRFRPAKVIKYKGADYLLTGKCNVISLTTGKVMKNTSEQHREVNKLAEVPWKT